MRCRIQAEIVRTLLIDAGNSAVKLAIAEPTGPGAAMQVAHAQRAPGAARLDPLHDQQSFRVRLENALRDRSLARETPAAGCIVASSTARSAIEAAVLAVTGAAIVWWGAQPQFEYGGVRLINGYRDPAQLGADRWHAMLGARALAGGAAFVLVQAGTATTIDGVTADGRFVGGEILPGSDMMLASLAQGTARLPHAEGNPAPFADNTDDAIVSGVRDAQAGAVERYWRRFVGAHARDQGTRLVLTGGGAARLAAALQDADVFAASGAVIQDNLVLRGLWLRSRASTAT